MNIQNSNASKKLYRNTNDKVLGGVCSGLAEFFGVSELLVRILWLIISLFFGIGFIIYIILWIAIPDRKRLQPELDGPDTISVREESNSTTGVFKNIFSLIGLIVTGCFLGLWGGWQYGQTLDSSGTIITLMIALFISIIGGVFGAIVGTLLVSKK